MERVCPECGQVWSDNSYGDGEFCPDCEPGADDDWDDSYEEEAEDADPLDE